MVMQCELGHQAAAQAEADPGGVLDSMHGGGLGQVANMGLEVPRGKPAGTAVPA
jgi:hypothetical protein